MSKRSGAKKHRKLRGLDPGIAVAVEVLRAEGVHTTESCQGGPGHAYSEPTVCFSGERDEGFRALSVVLGPHAEQRIGMRLNALRRVWPITDGEPTGPEWELTWWPRPKASGTPRTEDGQGRLLECACPRCADRPGSRDGCDAGPCLGLRQSSCDTHAHSPAPLAPAESVCPSSSPSQDPSNASQDARGPCLLQRAREAFRALSERSCAVSLVARALPPFSPPSRPSATAAGSFWRGSGSGSPRALSPDPPAHRA